MNILHKLTRRHLRMNRKRTIITIIGIVLSVTMVTAICGFIVSFQDVLYRDSVARSGPWHVQYMDLAPDTAQNLLQEPVFSEGKTVTTEENGLVVSLQFEKLNQKIFEQSDALVEKYNLDPEKVRFHTDLLVSKGILPAGYFRALYTFAAILLTLIAVGSVLVISNAFSISTDQRNQQFGLLQSAGATKKQIRQMVFFEAGVLAAIAIPLGILTGLLVQAGALAIANRILQATKSVNLMAWFRVRFSPAALVITVVAALLTVFLAAWRPAKKAAQVSAIEAIRQTRSIKLSSKDVKVSPLTEKVFGFEGVLAAKALRRNRGKYRATILALSLSIVLFIGVSSFAGILNKATSLFYKDFGSNVSVVMRDSTVEMNNRLAEEMAGWGGAEIFTSRTLLAGIDLPEKALSKEYRDYFPETMPDLRVIGLDNKTYTELCQTLKIDPQALENAEEMRGILLNTSGTYIQQGKRITFTPYHISVGEQFPVRIGETAQTMTVAGVTDQLPAAVFPHFHTQNLHLLVPEETVLRLRPPDEKDLLWLAVQADDAAVFAENATQLLNDQMPNPVSWDVLDYESVAANNRNISMLVMIFVYGFVALLSLIGVTSVVTTISTSIALRTREFAMLRSVGMTERGVAKMLNYESVLYGIKALLWGIPIGLLVCLLMYRAMTSVMEFAFIWPVSSMVISVVVIFILTFTTMSFARRKERQGHIVDALRQDII